LQQFSENAEKWKTFYTTEVLATEADAWDQGC
jgi:hypothetical protein